MPTTSLSNSFRCADAGLKHVLFTPRNARIQATVAVAVTVLGVMAGLIPDRRAVLLPAITSVAAGLLLLGPPFYPRWLG